MLEQLKYHQMILQITHLKNLLKKIKQRLKSLQGVQPSDEDVLQDYADIQSEKFAVSEKTKAKWNEVVKKEEDES